MKAARPEGKAVRSQDTLGQIKKPAEVWTKSTEQGEWKISRATPRATQCHSGPAACSQGLDTTCGGPMSHCSWKTMLFPWLMDYRPLEPQQQMK